MSLNESIYSLIPPLPVEAYKPPMHRSKYPADTPPSASTFAAGQTVVSNIAGAYISQKSGHRHRAGAATFGPALPHYSDPQAFLPKHTMPDLPPPRRFHYTDTSKSKNSSFRTSAHNQLNSISHSDRSLSPTSSFSPSSSNTTSPSSSTSISPLDSSINTLEVNSSTSSSKSENNNNNSDNNNNNDSHPTGGKKPKNFITENALAVIMADARKPLNKSLNYLLKSDYGQVPTYLSSVKREIEEERQYIRAVLARQRQMQAKNQPTLVVLPDDERVNLLSALKERWELVNREYQGMTHLVALDTHGKLRRKEHYEAHLQFLERAIEKLNKNTVYIKEE